MKNIAKKVFPILLGSAAGFCYWYFIGCSTGSCPISSHWYTSVAYGAFAGATFLLPNKKQPVQPSGPGELPANSHDQTPS